MTRLVSIALVILPFCSLAFAEDAALKELDGDYTLKAFERGGKPVPDEVLKGVSSISITGGKLKLTASGQERIAVLKLNPAKKPAEVELFPQGAEYEKGRKFIGLYQFEKGELTLVYAENGDRPTDLKGESANVTKLVLSKK
jgi:uncharacterized protein (TIGR03067 family)